jgi:hypothetical protein
MVTVAIIGVLAATAIPAFMKYTKKAKTSEARQNVRKIYDGARQYFMDPNTTDATGMQTLPRMYPTVDVSINGGDVAPDQGCCAADIPDLSVARCEPDALEWDGLWVMLHFAIPDPHYYAYFYDVGVGGANFYALARGNLDCDSDFAFFTMYGAVTAQNEPFGTGMIRRLDELE